MIVGKVYRITFLDHVSDDGDAKPARCDLWGQVSNIHEDYVTVICWLTDHGEDPGESDAYAILRSTIIEYKELVEA